MKNLTNRKETYFAKITDQKKNHNWSLHDVNDNHAIALL